MDLFLYGLLVLAAAVMGGAYGCYRETFSVSNRNDDPHRLSVNPASLPHAEVINKRIDHVLTLPYEDVYIQSRDGLKLHARYYHTADGAPLQIMVHGYRSMGVRDFCAGLPMALENGCNALLIDQRAHGMSEGRCLTFGIKEHEDCLQWVDYAVSRFGEDTRILLVGVSMGAATVMMTASRVPEQVKGILADCGYDSPEGIIRKVITDRHYPQALAYPFVSLGARIFGGFRLEGYSTQEALKESRVPVLFIHGESDGFVPCEMSRRNYDACTSEKTLLTVPGAGHGLSYLIDPESYDKAYRDLLKVLG